MAKNFDELLSKVSSCSKKKLSVACAQDKAVLEAVKAAKERGIADSILVGDEAKIKEILDLPENYDVSCIIAIGHPAVIPAANERKSLKEVLTFR